MGFEKPGQNLDQEILPEAPKPATKEKRDKPTAEDDTNVEKPEIKDEVFSDRERGDINKIPLNDFVIRQKERESEFLSGKKKLDAENEIAGYKTRREYLINSAVGKVEGMPAVERIMESISPDDLEIIKTQRGRYVNELSSLTEEEKQRLGAVFAREDAFRYYLQNNHKIDFLAGTDIYERLLEKHTHREDSEKFTSEEGENEEKETNQSS